MECQPIQRLYFVQWLRVFLISLVIAHHAAQPYGPTGGRWPIDDPANADWLEAFFAVNAAFFMGFFFLIAGYFTGSSYDRKGGAAFVRDRLIRLGIPLAFVTLFLFGPFVYFFVAAPEGFVRFFVFDYVGRWHIEEGQMWFVAQLLAFSLLYALMRWMLSARGMSDSRAPEPPGDLAILIFTVALGLVSAVVRTQYPQDVWMKVLWLVPVEPSHFPQYASMFVIGIVAGRGDWFTRLPAAIGKRWFAIGFAAFAIVGALSNFEDALPVDLGVIWGFVEAVVCVGMILGLLVLFRTYCNRPGPWVDWLGGNVYGAYIVHLFIVVALQAAILGMTWPATVKFLAVSAVAIVLSFALTGALRTIPLVRRVV